MKRPLTQTEGHQKREKSPSLKSHLGPLPHESQKMPFPAKVSKSVSYSKKCLWGLRWYKLQKKRWRAPQWLKHRAICTLTHGVLPVLCSASSSALLLKYKVLVKITSPTSHLGRQIEKPVPLKLHLQCNRALRKTPIIQSHRTTEYCLGGMFKDYLVQ